MTKKILLILALTVPFAVTSSAGVVTVGAPKCYPCIASSPVLDAASTETETSNVGGPTCYPCDATR